MEKVSSVGINRPLSETAKLFFIRASLIAPASVTAQAAVIAERCMMRSLSPADLGAALLGDADRIDYLRARANYQHIKAGKGPILVPIEKVRDYL